MVAPRTLHGQWLRRWKQTNHSAEELRERIAINLAEQKPVTTVGAGDEIRSNVGTIAVVTDSRAVYYLLAISRFDEHKRAHCNHDDLEKALLSLWDFYDVFGLGYPLYLPLIGTGMSRASFQYAESLELIKETVLKSLSKAHGKITIVVTQDAWNDLKLGERK